MHILFLVGYAVELTAPVSTCIAEAATKQKALYAGKVENVYVAYNFCHFAIFLPKFIKIGGNLTKF